MKLRLRRKDRSWRKNIESQQELPVAEDDREMSLSLPHHQEAFQGRLLLPEGCSFHTSGLRVCVSALGLGGDTSLTHTAEGIAESLWSSQRSSSLSPGHLGSRTLGSLCGDAAHQDASGIPETLC